MPVIALGPAHVTLGFPSGPGGKESACNVGDLGWEDPLQRGTATHSYSGLENSIGCMVYGVAKSQVRLSDSLKRFYFPLISPLKTRYSHAQ